MKKLFNAFGIRPNGSLTTFQGQYSDMVKMMLVVISIAYALGGATMGLKNAPERLAVLEKDMVKVSSVLNSIDSRLARIENALIKVK